MKPLSEGDIEACARDVPAFVAAIAERVLASAPRIVGFSSMGQTLASIAIGREIKRRRADVVTVLAGAGGGDKQRCTFCGYVTPGTRYRTKSPARIVDALDAIAGGTGLIALFERDRRAAHRPRWPDR